MKVFEKTSIGNLTLKNRLWRSATWLGLTTEDGHLTPEIIERYRALAVGGVGTIITGLSVIMNEEQPYPKMLSIYSDDFIPEYKEFTDMIHSCGANIIMQMGYGGSTTSIPADKRTIWGPSSVMNPSSGIIPVEMTKENIKEFVKAMGKAAKRAKIAGFDGVQIHAAHGYLLTQFLSPYFNTRLDEYGGCIEDRARIILEALKSMKKQVGADFPIFIKMHSDDQWGDKGLSEKESLWVAKELEKNGIAGIEFSGGNIDPESGNSASRSKLFKVENQSYFKEQTSRIAAELNIPVISVGGHRNIMMMEEILNNSNISYFSLSRPLHSEPDLPNKWKENPEHKARCVSCNNCWTKNGNYCILDGKNKR
ncbi:NADH:flavin oxidoreductase [Mycoplasmatota bacterium zrk1]